MKCYICNQEITEDQDFFFRGKDKLGNKMYRHDDKEHEEQVLANFRTRCFTLGGQIG